MASTMVQSSRKLLKMKSQSIPLLVDKAKMLLLGGGVIAMPTDTIYGLAADVNCQKAIQRLYDIKSRDHRKPLAICLADVEDLRHYAHITVPESLLTELLPGALTVIFQRNNRLNPFLNPQTDLVAIRIPDYPFVREVCRAIDGPLALTSANISTEPSCLSVQEFHSLWPSVDAVFDGGRLGQKDPEGKGSTIVDLSQQGYYRVMRPGCIYSQVIETLERWNLKPLD